MLRHLLFVLLAVPLLGETNCMMNPMPMGEGEGAMVMEGETAEGERPEGEPAEGETQEGEPAEGETAAGEPGEGEATEGEPSEGEVEEGEASEGEPVEGEPVEGMPVEGEGQTAALLSFEFVNNDPAPGVTETYTYEVLDTFPHDTSAFTQGLVFDDGEFFEGTGIRGESNLRRVDLVSGMVLQQVDLDAQFFGEGITTFGDEIYQLTWVGQTGFVYDRTTFEQLRTVSYQTEGWGITHDGERFIMTDGTDVVRFRDPETFQVMSEIAVTDENGDPVVRLNEIEYINGSIFANVWLTDFIVRIDPDTGNVTAWLDFTGLFPIEMRVSRTNDVLNGIAYDVETDRLFVTGKRWPEIFLVRLLPQ